MMDLNENFRRNLARIMADRKISKAAMSRIGKISKTHLDGILEGWNGVTLKTVMKISSALAVDPVAMLEDY